MNEGPVQAVPEHDQVMTQLIEEATEFATARGHAKSKKCCMSKRPFRVEA